MGNDKDIHPGDHVCLIYKDKVQQLSTLIPFIVDGLVKNHKCIYILDENSKEDLLLEFSKAGHEIEKCLSSEQLEILTAAETYLKDGTFDPDKMINQIMKLEHDALEEGFTGLRGTGEMTWVLNGEQEDENELLIYENKLNKIVKNSNIALLCQYNENKFSPEILINIIRTHPLVNVRGKLYENKYLFNPPEYKNLDTATIPADLYTTVIATITEEE